ncbi:DUF1648 domain-containing protein [Paucisalibacillus sp. EB02]|uniref:DUF1648 domain-containing protein n=1 Tax=Paucisalibacillus sp. EB02 TaxID=1347087 RepID=UPI0004B3C0AE|nr:DUF1648 domain-containing protein [Paucisalibacillus sp. EB02]
MAHPKIKVEASTYEKTFNFLSVLIIIGTFGYTFYMFSSLPDQIPTHFNGAGEADGWGSKTTVIFLPVLVILLFIGIYILSKFPHIFNYPIKVTEENASRVYQIARQLVAIINFEIVVLFTVLQIKIIQSANTGVSNISPIFSVLFIFIPLITCIVFFIRLDKAEK